MKCSVCIDSGPPIIPQEAVFVTVETGEGVCRGHAVPTILAGYGLERIRGNYEPADEEES